MINTNIIVLRKTHYSESSLIISALSAEFGKLDFLVRGAKRIGKRKFPQVDLFRELNVVFKDSSREMHGITEAELVREHDKIASSIENYRTAHEIASFVLRNSHPGLPCNKLYLALRNSFALLCSGEALCQTAAILKLVYLDENGLLGTHGHADQAEEKRHKGLQIIIRDITGNCRITPFSEQYWKSLSEWLDAMCRYHGLQ
jgi:DNA repair protein RecO